MADARAAQTTPPDFFRLDDLGITDIRHGRDWYGAVTFNGAAVERICQAVYYRGAIPVAVLLYHDVRRDPRRRQVCVGTIAADLERRTDDT